MRISASEIEGAAIAGTWAMRSNVARIDREGAVRKRLTTTPGITEVTARFIVAEIGLDTGRFATAGHLLSWAGLCPRCDGSAGRRRNTRVREDAPWLRATLVQAAWAAVATKNSYFRAQFRRLKAWRAPKKASVAVAASKLTVAFHMLRDGVDFRDLGVDYFTRSDRDRLAGRMVKRLKDLGYAVELKEAA